VLDAGCGTGLCGPLLRPYARHLAGVDLSAAMVAKAAERGDYDHLVVAELTAYLGACRHSYELIVSADTLVYFGELREVLAGMAHALVAGAWLAFSLESKESADDSPWQLSQSGRYVHGAAYVQQALDAAGLRLVSMTPATLRMNERQPVKGLIILASSQ
jgi:predicted TPR repeat methyltransferase